MQKEKMRRCSNFNCDHLRGHYCCADCDRRTSCRRPCLNHPSRCGLVANVKKQKTGAMPEKK